MKNRLLLILILFLVVVFVFVYEVLWAPNFFDGDRFIKVSKGENFQQVLDSLENAGIIRSRSLIELAGRTLELTTKMQIGKYRFKSGMSNKEILESIRYGKTLETIIVPIPEGLTAARQARIFTRSLGIDSTRFVSLVHDSNFAHSLGIRSSSLMGYLMPKTYNFYWQTDEEDIIRELVNGFWKVFDQKLQAEAKDRGLTTGEVLTMASIIEQETAIDSERAIIAGVYYNRLKKHIKLQADPTVQYLFSDGPRRLHYRDLEKESAYNTYRHYGLPPGPISNPGKASILAALYPAKHKYLFFVATGLGGHRFSKTFIEHKRAVRQLQKYREEQQATKGEG